MGKSGGSQQINNSDQYYQQLAGESNSLFDQFNSLYLPQLQKLLPELMQTVQGGNSPLMTAAQAPVNAQTSSILNTIQNNMGGVANPNALYSDIALQGQQNAGLAGDNTLSSALSALQNLFGMGYGGVNTGTNSLNSAAGGEGNLGLALNQQSNALWQDVLGAGATYAGYASGNPAMAKKGQSIAQNANSYAPIQTTPESFNDMQPSYYGGITPSVAPSTGGSAPISSMGPQP